MMLYLAFFISLSLNKQVIDVLAQRQNTSQRYLQCYRCYCRLWSRCPWNAMSKPDMWSVLKLPTIANIFNFIHKWMKRFITWCLPDFALYYLCSCWNYVVSFLFFQLLNFTWNKWCHLFKAKVKFARCCSAKEMYSTKYSCNITYITQ